MPRGPEFIAGLAAGLLGVALIAVPTLVWRFRKRETAPLAAVAAGGATIVALWQLDDLPASLLFGSLLAAIGAGLATLARLPRVLWALLLCPGAWVVAYRGDLPDSEWVPHVVFVCIVAASWAAVDSERKRPTSATGPAMILFSAGGIYATVPDTEQALALLGATCPAGLTGWPLGLTRLGEIGTPLWVSVAAWTVAVGGVGRDTSVIGGLACLGAFALEPGARLLQRQRQRLEPGHLHPVVSLVVHLGFVLVASRVAGLRRSMSAALGVVLVGAAVAMVALLLGRGRR